MNVEPNGPATIMSLLAPDAPVGSDAQSAAVPGDFAALLQALQAASGAVRPLLAGPDQGEPTPATGDTDAGDDAADTAAPQVDAILAGLLLAATVRTNPVTPAGAADTVTIASAPTGARTGPADAPGTTSGQPATASPGMPTAEPAAPGGATLPANARPDIPATALTQTAARPDEAVAAGQGFVGQTVAGGERTDESAKEAPSAAVRSVPGPDGDPAGATPMPAITTAPESGPQPLQQPAGQASDGTSAVSPETEDRAASRPPTVDTMIESDSDARMGPETPRAAPGRAERDQGASPVDAERGALESALSVPSSPPASGQPGVGPTGAQSPAQAAGSERAHHRAVDPGDLVDQIVRRADLFTTPLGQGVEIHLDPPELGKLHVRLTVEHGELAMHLRAESAEAMSLIRDNLPQLREALADRGLSAPRFSFDLSGGDPNSRRQFQPPQPNRRYAAVPAAPGLAEPWTISAGPGRIDYRI